MNRNLLDSVLKTLSYLYAGGKFKHGYTRFFLRKVACTTMDIPLLVGAPDLRLATARPKARRVGIRCDVGVVRMWHTWRPHVSG
jgi:hypothetical protein